MISTFSSRHNPNLPKLLLLLSALLFLTVCYQHYSGKQTQAELERDISLSQQRARQVEKELEAIQKGLQMDLSREKSDNEKMKSELQHIKFSMESLQEADTNKERSLQEYYAALQNCQSEREACDEKCGDRIQSVNHRLSVCLGEKEVSLRNVSALRSENDRYAYERQQLYRQLETLQGKVAQKDKEIQGMMNRAQQFNVNQYPQQNQYPQGNQMNGNPQYQQAQKAYNEAFGHQGDQQKARPVLDQQFHQQPDKFANQPKQSFEGFEKIRKAEETVTENIELPVKWRSQDSIKGPNEDQDKDRKPEMPGPVVQDAVVDNYHPVDRHLGIGGFDSRDNVESEPEVAGHAMKQIGAPVGGNMDNAAERDFVPGDGQGALLPPLGQAERLELEMRMEERKNANYDQRLPNNQINNPGDELAEVEARGDLNDDSEARLNKESDLVDTENEESDQGVAADGLVGNAHLVNEEAEEANADADFNDDNDFNVLSEAKNENPPDFDPQT